MEWFDGIAFPNQYSCPDAAVEAARAGEQGPRFAVVAIWSAHLSATAQPTQPRYQRADFWLSQQNKKMVNVFVLINLANHGKKCDFD